VQLQDPIGAGGRAVASADICKDPIGSVRVRASARIIRRRQLAGRWGVGAFGGGGERQDR